MKYKITIRLCISSFFLAYLSVMLDWALVFSAFKEIDLYLYTASFVLCLVSSFFVPCKYHLLIRGTSISHSIPSLIKINFISKFYSIFLPSALGPMVVQWYKVTRNQRDRSFFLAVTVFERMVFLLILLLFGLIPLFFYSSNSEIAILRGRILPIIAVSLILVCFSIAYFVIPHIRIFFNSIIDRIMAKCWRDIDIQLFLKNFSLNKPGVPLYVFIFILTVILQFFFLGQLFLLCKSALLPLNFVDIAWIGSLVLLLQTLPVSFAGIGIREGAYAYLFTIFNLSPEKGVLIGILFFSQMLIVAIIGGVFELTGM